MVELSNLFDKLCKRHILELANSRGITQFTEPKLDTEQKSRLKNNKEIGATGHEQVDSFLPFFGSMRATKLHFEAGQKYIESRQSAGAANATINRELALLRRAYNLAKQSGKWPGAIPTLPKNLSENNVRKGFFEYADFASVRSLLPAEIVPPIVTFAYWTGCRKAEILSLQWRQVDLAERIVRFDPGATKNDDPRVVPMPDDLHNVLSMRRMIRDSRFPKCPWVFFRDGQKIRDFRGAWAKACKDVGLVDEAGNPVALFHDLRRTGVRNLIRAGVPERVAMMISGHRTRAVFDRYNIVSESDLRDAAKRLSLHILEQAKAKEKGQTDNRHAIATQADQSKLVKPS